MWSRINAQLKDEHHASEWRNFYKCGWKQNSKETTDRNVHPIVKDKDGLGSAMIGTHEFIKKRLMLERNIKNGQVNEIWKPDCKIHNQLLYGDVLQWTRCIQIKCYNNAWLTISSWNKIRHDRISITRMLTAPLHT